MRQQEAIRDINGMTDITLLIPIKQGFIPAIGTLTYASRLKLVLDVLTGMRKASLGVDSVRPFSDSVDRIRFLQAFRYKVVDDSQVLLAATFDGSWEPYLRSIWRDLGPLLDLIVCHCAGYPISVVTPFSRYDAWVRRHNINGGFFYTHGRMSVNDLVYLDEFERISRAQRNSGKRDKALAKLRVPAPADATSGSREDLLRLGAQAVHALYQLRPFFSAPIGEKGSPASDDMILLRAARLFLLELHQTAPTDTAKAQQQVSEKAKKKSAKKSKNKTEAYDVAELAAYLELTDATQRGKPVPKNLNWIDRILDDAHKDPLRWFLQVPLESDSIQQPAAFDSVQALQQNQSQIQGGIIEKYPDISVGCLLFLRVEDAATAIGFLQHRDISSALQQKKKLHENIALTLAGLQKMGIPDPVLARFPEEFRLGMEQRAGILGDLFENHPVNWKLPLEYGAGASANRLQLAMVDVVVQLRATSKTPLTAVRKEYENCAAFKILHIQNMHSSEAGVFGYSEGFSQPKVEAGPFEYYRDQVPLGDLVLGYPSSRDDGRVPEPHDTVTAPYLHNGSFMVIRKIRQNKQHFDAFLGEAARQYDGGRASAKVKTEVMSKLMGREPGGHPLINPDAIDYAKEPQKINDFLYKDADPFGEKCPLHSHIRRANPRDSGLPGPVPRIVRRGMRYDESVRKKATQIDNEGLVFIAYNSSIANQFEVIQRWLTGGNSSGAYSGCSDPLLGVPARGEARTFVCLGADGEPKRLALDKTDKKGHIQRRLLTELQWGMYLFVPSIRLIRQGFAL